MRDYSINHSPIREQVRQIQYHGNDNGEDFWGYVPKKHLPFPLIRKLLKGKVSSIVDIGCGFCENLLMLGEHLKVVDLTGVEINQDYYNSTKALNLSINLFLGDYRSFDISRYDLIYSYEIAKTDRGMEEFFGYVDKNAKAGAFVLYAFSKQIKIKQTWKEIYRDKDCIIFQK